METENDFYALNINKVKLLVGHLSQMSLLHEAEVREFLSGTVNNKLADIGTITVYQALPEYLS